MSWRCDQEGPHLGERESNYCVMIVPYILSFVADLRVFNLLAIKSRFMIVQKIFGSLLL